MSKDNGGPAFPQQFHMSPKLDQGMTLRAYLAAEAIKAQCFPVSVGDYEGLAREAVKLADALLKELAK